MFAFVLIQLAFDFLIVGFAVFYLLKKSTPAENPLETQVEGRLQLIDHKAKESELIATQYRARLDAELARLVRLCDQATAIVERSAMHDTMGPTIEEHELKSAIQQRDVIPTLKQIEKTKERLNHDLRVDLRSLLRDQLV